MKISIGLFFEHYYGRDGIKYRGDGPFESIHGVYCRMFCAESERFSLRVLKIRLDVFYIVLFPLSPTYIPINQK